MLGTKGIQTTVSGLSNNKANVVLLHEDLSKWLSTLHRYILTQDAMHINDWLLTATFLQDLSYITCTSSSPMSSILPRFMGSLISSIWKETTKDEAATYVTAGIHSHTLSHLAGFEEAVSVSSLLIKLSFLRERRAMSRPVKHWKQASNISHSQAS